MKRLLLAAALCSAASAAPAQALAPSATDQASAAFQGAVPMTVGTTYAAQRSVGVLATVAGNVTFAFGDASTLTLPVSAGWQTFPFAVTSVSASGTTATATYYEMK